MASVVLTNGKRDRSLRDMKVALGQEVRIRRDLSGHDLTTFALGGPVPVLLEPLTIPGCARLIRDLLRQELPFRILGAGSNLVINDAGVAEPVVRLGREFSGVVFQSVSPGSAVELERLRREAVTGGHNSLSEPLLAMREEDAESRKVKIFAFAGCPVMGLSRRTVQAGLAGLEFAVGIPGSVGGAVLMNAGAHGEEFSSVVTGVVILDQTGEIRSLTRDELNFSYRHSNIPNGSVVLGAELELRRRAVERVVARRNSCLEYRRRTQPLHLPSAGSVFRNPRGEGLPSAATLLEGAGVKGRTCGGVQFSELHANWLVKVSAHASARDVVSLIAEGQRAVWEKFSVELSPEIVLW